MVEEVAVDISELGLSDESLSTPYTIEELDALLADSNLVLSISWYGGKSMPIE